MGANWRSVLGPLGRAVLIHQRQQQAVNTHAAAAGSAAPAPAAPAAGGPPPPAPLSSLVTKAELEAADAAVTEAYHVCPNFEVLVPALVEGGLEGLRSRWVWVWVGMVVRKESNAACRSRPHMAISVPAPPTAHESGLVPCGCHATVSALSLPMTRAATHAPPGAHSVPLRHPCQPLHHHPRCLPFPLHPVPVFLVKCDTGITLSAR